MYVYIVLMDRRSCACAVVVVVVAVGVAAAAAVAVVVVVVVDDDVFDVLNILTDRQKHMVQEVTEESAGLRRRQWLGFVVRVRACVCVCVCAYILCTCGRRALFFIFFFFFFFFFLSSHQTMHLVHTTSHLSVPFVFSPFLLPASG